MAGLNINRCSAGLSQEFKDIPGWNRVQSESAKVKLVSRHKPGKNMQISRQTPGRTIECRWEASRNTLDGVKSAEI